MNEFRKMFEPIRIGGIEVKNRIAMAPMSIRGLSNPDGSPGQRARDYYIERARGGVGLIITGIITVDNDIEPLRFSGLTVTESAIAGFAELAEAVHAFGAKIFAQLSAGFGRVARPALLLGQPVSASPVPYYWKPEITCVELKTEQVESLVESFGTAARILVKAGIDGVELHGHEGYLFDQFTTPIWNKRSDRYGGDLSERLRLPIEVLKEIKASVGKDFPVQYRFGLKHYMKQNNTGALPGEEYTEAGRDIKEGLAMAKLLEEAGFDSLHVDAGCYDSHYWSHPPIYQADGCLTEMAAAVKKVVKIPVITVGKLANPELAKKVLVENKADMIALGRGLLSDPFWVRKVGDGQAKKIRPCIGCYDGCLGRIFSGKPLSCAVNPSVGRERDYALKKADRPKKVLIAGGGVAGMEAARTAAIRGYQVTIYEKNDVLGGCLIPAAIPLSKKAIHALSDWYVSEVHDLGVDVKLGCEATAELVERENADVVIIATGGKPIIPSLPVKEKGQIVTASEVLSGAKPTAVRTIVVGGGLLGCETAIWLAKQGKRVTLVEKLEELMAAGITVPHSSKNMVIDMLRFNKVEIITGFGLVRASDQGVILQNAAGREESVEAETVVIAAGFEPERELYQSLRGSRPDLYIIGDAREPRNIMGAIWDAYEVGRAI